MVGLTAGIGAEYEFYAREAARRFERFTGVPTRILGAAELDSVRSHSLMTDAARDERGRAQFLKLFLFDLVPEAEDIIWFDADYCCVAPWDPTEGYDSTFTAVRDRTAHLLEVDYLKSSSAMNYFNTGFFIANRTRHEALFAQAREQWRTVEWTWHDQCLLNAMLERECIPVRYLDRRYNCMDHGTVFHQSDVRAIHRGTNYDHYLNGTAPTVTREYRWDAAAMRGLAGYYNLEYADGWACMSLLSDGTTGDGHVWFATTECRIHFATVTGDPVEQPLRIRRTG